MGIPLYVGADVSGSGVPATRLGCFVKTNTVYTHTTALMDAQFGALGYLRAIWTPAENFVAEALYRGISQRIVLTPGGYVFMANHWYWVALSLSAHQGSGAGYKMTLSGQVSLIGGAVEGVVSQESDISGAPGLPSSGFDLVSSSLGWGVPLSSSYNPFPKAIGDELTELVVETTNGAALLLSGGDLRTPLGVPSAQLTPTSTPYIVALYHCDDPLGSNQVVHDATTNHYDLAAATDFNGDLILRDSPF